MNASAPPDEAIDYARILELAGRFGLPLHVVCVDRFRANAASFSRVADRLYPDLLVAFSVKSNPCRGAVRAAKQAGLGVDTASEHELRAALEEGIKGPDIVCNGNAKSDDYLRMAIDSGALVAADSLDELMLLDAVAAWSGRTARVLTRFSGMPLSGFTAADQSTATLWTKFGIPVDRADEAFDAIASCGRLHFEGISAHIGTQICRPQAYYRLMDFLLPMMARARQAGLETSCIDIGGGFPVSFVPDREWQEFQARLRNQLRGGLETSEWVTWDNLAMGYAYLKGRAPADNAAWQGKAYHAPSPGAGMLETLLVHRAAEGRTVRDALYDAGAPRLIVEPGRSLMATAGLTIARALGAKTVMGSHVVTLDMGIVNHGTNLITPDMFPAEVLPRSDSDEPVEAFLAGRLCFTGDMLSKTKVRLNRLPERGEIVVIRHTGAYSADHFASNSCGFQRPGKVALQPDGSVEVWRRPELYGDVFPCLE